VQQPVKIAYLPPHHRLYRRFGMQLVRVRSYTVAKVIFASVSP
jgi:hypothetical protein